MKKYVHIAIQKVFASSGRKKEVAPEEEDVGSNIVTMTPMIF